MIEQLLGGTSCPEKELLWVLGDQPDILRHVLACPEDEAALCLGCPAWKKGGQRAPRAPFKRGEYCRCWVPCAHLTPLTH